MFELTKGSRLNNNESAQESMPLPKGFELLQGSRIDKPQMESTQEQEQPSFGQEAKRIGAGLLASVPSGLVKGGQALGELGANAATAAGRQISGDPEFNFGKLDEYNVAGNPKNYPGYQEDNLYESPEFKQSIAKEGKIGPKQRIANALGFENLEPQSGVESTAQGIAEETVPNLLNPYLGTATKFAMSTAGNATKNVLKKAGFGDIAQTVGDISARGLVGFAKGAGNFVKKISSVYKKVGEIKDKAITKLDNIGDKIQAPTGNVFKNVAKLKDDAAIQLSSKDYEAIEKDFDKILKWAADPKSLVKTGWQLRKATDKLAYNSNLSKEAKDYMIASRGQLTGFLDNVKNPTWQSNWPIYQDIHRGQVAESTLTKVLDNLAPDIKDLAKADPTSKAILGAAIKYAGGLKSAAGYLAGLGAKELSKASDFFRNSKVAQSLLKNLDTAAIEGDSQAVQEILKRIAVESKNIAASRVSK